MNNSTFRMGVVEEFDEHVGLGYIDSDGERYLFHCVELVDGTRSIAVGTKVRFVSVVRFGNREASAVEATN